MQIEARLIEILGRNSGTTDLGKDWEKMEFLLETESRYPKKIKLTTLNKAAIEVISRSPMGALLTCDIEIASREFHGKWYTDATAHKVYSDSQLEDVPNVEAESMPTQGAEKPLDDMPF